MQLKFIIFVVYCSNCNVILISLVSQSPTAVSNQFSLVIMKISGRVVCWKSSDISNEHIASILIVEE
jgi:hypothetical protein